MDRLIYLVRMLSSLRERTPKMDHALSIARPLLGRAGVGARRIQEAIAGLEAACQK